MKKKLNRLWSYILPIPFFFFQNLEFNGNKQIFHEFPNRSHQVVNKEKTTLFLFESKETRGYLGHFFHLLEHIVGHWAFYGDKNSDDVSLIVLESDDWKGPNQINEHLLKALFPHARIETWKEFCGEWKGKKTNLEKVIISNRAVSFTNQECIKTNKMLAASASYISSESIENLARKVHAYANTKFENSRFLRVTYLKRDPPRRLEPHLEERLLSLVRQIEGVLLRVENFSDLSFKEQINIIGNTDILIGVHGNGLSHLLFLPSHARVIEIFPPHFHAFDYRLFAGLRGLSYVGISADQGTLGEHESIRIGAFGRADVPIEKMDLSLILSEIK